MTQIKSVRMSVDTWARLEEIAKAEGKTRNSLIAEILEEHCKKAEQDIDKGEKVC